MGAREDESPRPRRVMDRAAGMFARGRRSAQHSLTYLVTCCTAYDCARFPAIRWDIDEKKSRINLEDNGKPSTFAPAFERERRTIEKV